MHVAANGAREEEARGQRASDVHNSDQSAAEIFIRQAVPGLAVALAPLLIVTDLAGVSSLCKASLSGCCCL